MQKGSGVWANLFFVRQLFTGSRLSPPAIPKAALVISVEMHLVFRVLFEAFFY